MRSFRRRSAGCSATIMGPRWSGSPRSKWGMRPSRGRRFMCCWGRGASPSQWLSACCSAAPQAPTRAAPKWKLTSAFTAFPAIYEQGGGSGQGHVCTIATLTELAPGGPVTSGPIRLHYDNEGAVTDDAAKVLIDGRIVNLKKDVSFDI